MNPIKNLFLVDDDELYVFLTKKIIATTKLVEQVNVFGNGKIAVDFIKENVANPDLLPNIILLDINMPVLDGWGFLEDYTLLMPELSKKIALYIVTSSISPQDVEKAKGIVAVTDFIMKPFTKEKFLFIAEKYIET